VVEEIDGASGGRVVRFTGDTGRVQFRSLPVPAAARYRVSVVYAPGDAWYGSVHGLDSPAPVTFSAGTGCCATVVVEVSLALGSQLSIDLADGSGVYPAIDVVTINQI
jgi:hypothetical protein